MAIIVETGAGIANANSYVQVSAVESFAEERGVSLTTDTPVLILKAMDYLEQLESKFKGSRVNRDQALSFPRTGVVVNGWAYEDDELPPQLLKAQMFLCLEIDAGSDPINPESDLPVIGERIEGAIDIKYATPYDIKTSKNSNSQYYLDFLLSSVGSDYRLLRG